MVVGVVNVAPGQRLSVAAPHRPPLVVVVVLLGEEFEVVRRCPVGNVRSRQHVMRPLVPRPRAWCVAPAAAW